MAQPLLKPHAKRHPSVQRRILPDLERVSQAAAEYFVRLARQQASSSGRFSVALSGGSTPRRLYELLTSDPYRSRIPWDRVHVFWADERCVPPDHPESNFRMANDLLLTHVPLSAGNVHRVPTESGDAMLAAATYEHILRMFFKLQDGSWPAFDLVVLGLGEDGHTASLFPRSAALHETKRLVIATSGGNPHVARVTLTIPALNHARHLLWLVASAEKAAVVQRVLEGPQRSEECPAQLVRPQDRSLWLLDRAAAALLDLNRLPAVRI